MPAIARGIVDCDLPAELAALLRGIPSKINLIPFNPFPETRFGRNERPF